MMTITTTTMFLYGVIVLAMGMLSGWMFNVLFLAHEIRREIENDLNSEHVRELRKERDEWKRKAGAMSKAYQNYRDSVENMLNTLRSSGVDV